MGKSICFLAVEAAKVGKQPRIVAVDTWADHQTVTTGETFEGEETYRRFLANIEPVSDRIEVRRESSLEAAESFDDASCDFVFIDASHEYEDVRDDLVAWYPKVKSGGVLAGHDYHWPGVSRAVKEFTAANGLQRPRKTELCWVIEVGTESRTRQQRLADLFTAPFQHLLSLVSRVRYERMVRRRRSRDR